MSRISLNTLPKESTIATELQVAAIEQNDALAERFSEKISDVFWKLELTKFVADGSGAALVQSEQQSTRQDTGLNKPYSPALLRIVFGFSTAVLVWLYCIIRYGRGNRHLEPGPGICFAVHPEVSTRTSHLLPPRFKPPQDVVYLVLGRPRALSELHAQLPDNRLQRPISIRAAITSFPKAVASFSGCLTACKQAGFTPDIWNLSAMFFRQMLGCCHQAWWAAQTHCPDQVVFGHTGLADTARLEQAIQLRGGKTIHLVHGVSVGWNFTGTSDLALWKCGLDAQRHQRLFGYGRNDSIIANKPAFQKPGPNWVVFSNYLHPMHLAYRDQGTQPELALIDFIAKAAKQAEAKITLHWKLHPSHVKTAAKDIQQVKDALQSQGIELVDNTQSMAQIAQGALILTTPSTIALDALQLGFLPIVVNSFPFAKTSVFQAFSLQANSSRTLIEAVRNAQGPELQAGLFDQTWDAVRPAKPFSLDQTEPLV